MAAGSSRGSRFRRRQPLPVLNAGERDDQNAAGHGSIITMPDGSSRQIGGDLTVSLDALVHLLRMATPDWPGIPRSASWLPDLVAASTPRRMAA
jgi:hypothetical protein